MHCITESGATRWVFVRIMPAKTAARRFLRDLHRACPIRELCMHLGDGI